MLLSRYRKCEKEDEVDTRTPSKVVLSSIVRSFPAEV